jgi:hypothetical protein
MVELTPKGKYSIAAAILGLLSFLLPWVAFTITNGSAFAINGESPATLLSDFVTLPSVTATTDSAILAWQRMALGGWDFWVVGSVIFLLGCFVTLLQSFESTRWGGFVMLGGLLVSASGISSFSATFTTDAGYTATVGFSIGIGLAVIATLVALVPAFKVGEGDEWVRDPEGRGWIHPVSPFSYAALEPEATPSKGTSPSPSAASVVGPASSAIPPPAAPSPTTPERRFCPECGAWYLAGESACPRDGAALKRVVESGAKQPPDESRPPP